MTTPHARRVMRELTPEEQGRLRLAREQVAARTARSGRARPDADEAREEATLSGELHRAVHASPLSLSAIAERTGVTPLALDEFLTGERTLGSDVLDRLAGVLGFVLRASA